MTSNEYKYGPGSFNVSQSMKNDFNNDGYILVRCRKTERGTTPREVFERGMCMVINEKRSIRAVAEELNVNRMTLRRDLLNKEEVERIKNTIVNGGMMEHAYMIADSVGSAPIMMLWKHPGSDTTGLLARCEKVVNTVEELLGVKEVYHYHGKVILKPPVVGGQFEWHQDYGYWYRYCLKPDMMAVMLAIDECTPENGGLSVLKGSHKYGRVDHGFSGGQQGADMQRVNRLMEKCELVKTNLQPGDALFFHSNVLHYSSPNTSQKRRIAINLSYNDSYNEPVEPDICPKYTKLHKVPNSAILDCETPNDFTGKEFIKPSDDKLVKEKIEQ